MENNETVIGALADCVSVIEKDGIKIINVQHEKASAAISLHGGHVISFTPKGQKDVLWLSEKSAYNSDTAIRGGIPVCWPWFGRIAAPAHGFARTSLWHLVEHRETDNGVVVCLGLEENEETLAIWPYAFQARLYVEISDTLKVTLDVCNTDDKAWKWSGALHSYFNVADIRESITTGMGAEYQDSLQGGKICQGGQTLQLTDTVDRVYTQPEPIIEVSDPQNSRTIIVKNHGHDSAVIWNPWAEGAKSMGDMPDDGYNTMLCVESTLHAKSLDEGKELQPGDSHQLVTEISVK